jgi:hypothetical protein
VHCLKLARQYFDAQIIYSVADLHHVRLKTQSELDHDHAAELMQEAEDFIARSPGLREMAEKEVRRRAKAIQKTSLQQQANSSTTTTIPRALPAHTAIDRLSNRQST